MTLACETEFRYAVGPTAAASTLTVPTPPPTENRLVVPVTLHGPPVSAVPQPLDVVRPNASAAITEVTVTACVTDPVAPWLSVTVKVT